MKVLILGFTKLIYMPYMHFYIKQLQDNNCDVHLLYWSRDDKKDISCPDGVTLYSFKENLEDSTPFKKKLPYFIKYRKFAKEIIKSQSFDLLIILHTTPGVLLSDVILKDFKKRYILDYRDFTYENIFIYKKIIHRLVNNSILTYVSSDAFRKVLPNKPNIITSHNILLDSIESKYNKRPESLFKNPIKIRYWGLIRYVKTNIAIIKSIANNPGFELHFHGRYQGEAKLIKEYCEKNRILNVFFHGEYSPEDRVLFASDTDFIQNAQDFDNVTKYAISNKFYDGAIFRIPQICTKGSFMGENVEKYGLGVSFDVEKDDFKELILDYTRKTEYMKFYANCDFFLEKVIAEYKLGISIMGDSLKN